MGDWKDIGKFAGRFVVCFGLLMLPWPFLQEGFASGFQSATAFLLRITHPTRFHSVGPRQDPLRPSVDTEITLVDRSQVGADGRAPATLVLLDSRSLAWTPSAMVIALFGATPLPRAGRWKGLLAGLVTVNVLASAGLMAAVGTAVGAASGRGGWTAVVAAMQELLVRNTWTSFTIPAAMWVIWLRLRAETTEPRARN